jgi:hypothetical protein
VKREGEGKGKIRRTKNDNIREKKGELGKLKRHMR